MRDVLNGVLNSRTDASGLYSAFPATQLTLAEQAAGVTPVNYAYAPGYLLRYGVNTTPGTTDMTAAIRAALSASDDIWLPGEDILNNGGVQIPSGKKIHTQGFATRIVNNDASQFDTPIWRIVGSDIEIEDISFFGAIATQTGEWNHCIAIRPDADPIENIRIGRIYGENIRGDVFTAEGLAALPVTNVKCVSASGFNVYRNIVSFIGGADVDVGSIINLGQIGYRDFDVEPNPAGGNQNPTGIRIGYVSGSSVQLAGDTATPNGSVDIGFLDLNNDRYQDSVPGYPSHAPSPSGNIAFLIKDSAYLHVGTLKARNYGERLINDTISTTRCKVVIDQADIDDCNTTETTFKTLVEGGTLSLLEINGGTIVLQGSDRYIAKDVRVALRNLTVSGGCIVASASQCEVSNITYDGTGVSGALFGDIDDSHISTFIATNDGSATFMQSCQNNKLQHISIAPGTFTNSGTNHLVEKSTINGVFYDTAMLPGGVVTLGASGTSPVITNGQTISTANTVTRVSPGGAVTGIILQSGLAAGQEVTVINESVAANTVTFAAAGTSHVADGVTSVIAGLRCAKFTWSAATSLWYRS
jgi:hypothetical protein